MVYSGYIIVVVFLGNRWWQMQYPSYVCIVWLLTQLSIRIPLSIHPLHPIMFELFTELCGRLLTLLFYRLLVSRCHSRCALAVRGAILGCLATGAGFSRQINSDRSVRKGALITESRCRKEENRSLQLLELQKTQSTETDINSHKLMHETQPILDWKYKCIWLLFPAFTMAYSAQTTTPHHGNYYTVRYFKLWHQWKPYKLIDMIYLFSISFSHKSENCIGYYSLRFGMCIRLGGRCVI